MEEMDRVSQVRSWWMACSGVCCLPLMKLRWLAIMNETASWWCQLKQVAIRRRPKMSPALIAERPTAVSGLIVVENCARRRVLRDQVKRGSDTDSPMCNRDDLARPDPKWHSKTSKSEVSTHRRAA